MSEYLNKLTQREKLMLGIGAGVVALCLFLLLVLGPVMQWRENAQLKAMTAERNFALIEEAAARQPPKRPNRSANSTTSVRNAVYQTAARANVTLSYVNALSDGRVTVNANDAKAQQLYAWLGVLEQEHAIRVESADVARSADGGAGVLAFQATFARAAQ